MPLGEVRKAANGRRSVYAQIGLWAEKHGDWIQIHISGPSRTWVTNNPASVRFHATLFRDLRKTLVGEDCWPFGEEGAEAPDDLRFRHLQPVKPRDGSPLASDIILEERGPR